MLVMIACFSFYSFAQSGEVKFLDRFNPERPTSDAWKGITNSVAPVTVFTPVTLLATGYFTKDKQLQKEGWKATGAVLINVAVTQGLKKLVGRQRPYN